LDDHRTWYRYHHLFADALRNELAPATAQALHRRAAGWFAAHDLRAEAIRHALTAGDFTTAAGWIEAASGPLLRNGRMVTLLGWLDALPEPVIGQYPELAATKAMALLLTGQVEAVEAYVADLERTEAAQDPALRGRLFALRAWLANAQGERGEMEAAEAALELLPETATLFHILALIPLSHARMNAGDLTGSTRALRDAYRLAEAAEQHFAGLGALANLVFNLLEQGARREALALCREALARHVDADGRPLPALGLVYLPLSKAHYLGDDLDQAERYAREGLDLCRTLFSGTMAGGDAEQVLAQVYFARGEPAVAFALLEEAYQAAHRQGITPVAQSLRSAEALLRLRQGELDAVARWLDSLGRPIPSWARRAHLAWLLAARRWEEAESLLREWAEQLTAREQFGRLISVRLMQAQAAAGQGRRAEALRDLEEAVARAAPEGYRRFFLDAPAEVQMLLPHVRGAAPDFVDDLLARSEFDFPAPREVPEPLIEPLSEREREVLGLIAAGLSNREIAEQLFITVGTVKRHAHNLYGKLEVSSRTEAVARARELGLL
jgi:LuxR family maltose regulon positive regulatory protein